MKLLVPPTQFENVTTLAFWGHYIISGTLMQLCRAIAGHDPSRIFCPFACSPTKCGGRFICVTPYLRNRNADRAGAIAHILPFRAVFLPDPSLFLPLTYSIINHTVTVHSTTSLSFKSADPQIQKTKRGQRRKKEAHYERTAQIAYHRAIRRTPRHKQENTDVV